MTDTLHRTTLLNLLKENAYKKGEFTLSSGEKSEHYVNCKPVTLSCEGNALVCGVAQRAYYSGHRHLDALIVRRNPKSHGTKEVIEGHKPPKGSVVTVLEDVTTTGSSAIKAVNCLRDAGYIVNRVVAIVDRQENHRVWENNEIEFISLFKLQDLVES